MDVLGLCSRSPKKLIPDLYELVVSWGDIAAKSGQSFPNREEVRCPVSPVVDTCILAMSMLLDLRRGFIKSGVQSTIS